MASRNYPLLSRSSGAKSDATFNSRGEKTPSAQRSENRYIGSSANKDELITKRQNLCFGAKLQPEWESRSLNINPVLSDDIHRFLGNQQHTQRWALPKQALQILLSNAKRLPYIWGFIIVIIHLVSPILLRKGTPTTSWQSSGAVLITSFFISFIISGLDAIKRFVVGKCVDYKRCQVLQPKKSRMKKIRVGDIVVGNIVKLTCDEQVPADMILLSCSNPDGQVHVDTALVDGDRDLKVKYCTKYTKGDASLHSFTNIRGQVICDRPSPDLENFNATLRLKGHPRPRNVHIHNFIMKGSIIRNTASVYGVVTHTGPDTKIAQNISKETKCVKFGSVDALINQFTIIVSCIYLLCLFVSMGTRWSTILSSERRKAGVPLVTESLLFVTLRFVVLYAGFIPVTLPAIADLLRYAFSNFYDGHMDYSFLRETASKDPTNPNSVDLESVLPVSWTMNHRLLEELGMVDIIFCDKTGTLTSNDLKISLLTVGNMTFDTSGDRTTLQNDVERELEHNDKLDKLLKLLCLCNATSPVPGTISADGFSAPGGMGASSSQSLKHSGSLNSDLSFGTSNNAPATIRPLRSKIHFGNVSYIEAPNQLKFSYQHLDSNNSLEYTDPGDAEGDGEETSSSSAFQSKSGRSINTVFYKSPFKEDECMISLARDLGYKVIHRSKSTVQLECRGAFETWNIVGLNQFTSQRRRMSIVAKRADNEGATIFVKGSGETIVRLIRTNTDEEERELAMLPTRLDKLTSAGYRVLVCAYRNLTSDETRLYQRQFANAEDSVYSGDMLHEEAAVMVEGGLTYLGIVAFRDEIQPGVHETLDLLMEAGVRVWMTTGDNRNAAIETAYLTKLLVSPCRIFDCKLPYSRMDDITDNDGTILYESFLQQRSEMGITEQLCLVVEGSDLKDFLATSRLQTCFVNMLCLSDVVIACRLSPSEKAEFVRLVKCRLTPTPVTLAIGDGLNDVKMMQEAHVGVAVLGSTPDAVAYADFVTSHFAGLRSLLFFQGSNSLQVISAAIYWTFFKSLCLVMPIFYYQGHTDWVGLDLYGSFIQLAFHLIFTAIPIIFCGLFDQPLSEPILTHVPLLYTLCRRRFHINLLRLGFCILEGILSSLFCYLSIQTTTLESPIFRGGSTISARTFGLLCSLGSLQMSNSRLLMESFARNNSFGILLTLVFLFAMPPAFLCLCFLLGGRTLRNATFQVVLWQPVYFLFPVWISTGVVCHVATALVQSLVCPNMSNYLKHWLSSQRCDCPKHGGGDSVETALNSTDSGGFSVSVPNTTSNTHFWCDRLLMKVRNEFNLHGLEALMRMIPTPRPFRVREGDLSGMQPLRPTSSMTKDQMEDMQKSQNDVKLHRSSVSHLIDRFTLRFKDIQLEADYKLHKRRNHYRTNRIWYRIIFIAIGTFYILDWILDYTLKVEHNEPALFYSILPPICVSLLSLGCAILTFHTTYFMTHVNKALGILVCCMILQYIVTLTIIEPLGTLQPLLFPIFTFVILHIAFIYALVANVIFIIVSIYRMEASVHILPLFFAINIFVAFVGYRLEYNNRKNFLFEFSARNARKKQSELLNTMLPNFVVSKMINARLNEDGIPIGFEADEHEVVSVVFCDVCNFQNLVATVEPTILVELLDSLFLAFDRCAEQFSATKIETVFETYLAALGLSRTGLQCPYESAASAIDMALSMIEVARQIRYPAINETTDGSFHEQDECVTVKIGIHSGKVISGLVGAKKPQYALFGDTVNTASRMKTTGECGHIHISESTYDLVKSDTTLNFDHRETFVKGKGIMKTHLLLSAEGSAYPNFEVMDTSTTLDTVAVTSGETTLGESSSETFALGSLEMENEVGDCTPSSNVLFECVEKTHILNKMSPTLNRALSTSSRASFPLFPIDYDRACGRKIRISAAIGVLTEDEDGMMIRGQPALLRHCSTYSVIGTSSNSTPTNASRCLAFLRRSNTPPPQSNTIASSTLQRSSSFSKQQTDDDDELNSGIDSSDMRMKTGEWVFLRFNDKLQEDRYRSHFYHNRTHINTIEQTLIIFLMTFVAQTILEIAIPRSYEDLDKVERLVFFKYTLYWTVRSIYILLVFVMWLLFRFNSFAQRSECNTTMWLTFVLNLLFVSAACVFSLSNSWAVSHSAAYSHYVNMWLPSDSFKFYFYIVVIHHNNGMLFQTCLLVNALFMMVSMTFISFSVVQTATTAVTLFSIPAYILFNLISAHCKEAIDRSTFYTNEKARMIEARVGQMLNDMLPKSVLEEFKNDKLKMSYCHEKMSFLFSDIVGFTLWANSVDASLVIALLQRLFARFDRSSTKHGLYKLCTIGDAYVVVSEPAIEVPTEQEAISNIEGILQMAQSMIKTIQEVRESFNIPGLNMRIGLHYGHAVGGVIGSGRLRYDLWGMDIHTANAMESHGIPGKMCVSERLKLILMTNFPERFTFEFNNDIQVIDRCVRSYIITSDSDDNWLF
ncbi:putative phospholipid-transporting ATPase 5 [Babesia sp. Xinjiang]|uniref:putative phospholipid-transporting ATPase 5 n=1 Tax=Babesia sp. Xinjiang TaxID=462227 RepID=UPI000A26226F|nr:putative phospholipid-transporting ATPase 5 [Babesia sp. Xinjiang]ORM42067.1 putative phospholipid-transporting ATPase 5 [Babesia sp. Xinjiang]